MVENLEKLYNTMILIETKGNSTKIMGECLKFVEQLIREEHEKKTATETPAPNVQ